jgi:hypothetical protein
MGGGLIQLVAYGAQDVYLTGNPQITFFKVVYRRHTNFARECISQVFDGTADVGNSVSCTLSRSGDLVSNIYLTTLITKTNANDGSCRAIGNALIKNCEIEIGGQKIDKHYSQWLSIYAELSGAYRQVAGAADVTPDYDGAAGFQYATTGYGKLIAEEGMAAAAQTMRVYTPLRFWFCNNPGLALPLIALQYHEVRIKMTFETSNNLVVNTTDTLALSDTQLLVDYIYLDTDERRRFAQVSHEYLIEQVQHEGVVSPSAAGTSFQHTVNFNHPVKYMAWVVEAVNASSGDQPQFFRSLSTTYNNIGTNDEGSAKLVLNGNDRFEPREMSYFTQVQPYQHCKRVPPSERIGVYSFANNPMDHQPSGTCNFSRIDSAIWHFKFGVGSASAVAATDNLHLYAVNYNVLRIMSGMGGLAYSN